MKLLIIGQTYPEPTTTAAGSRIMQLIELFLEDGYDITFASTARSSQLSVGLESMGVKEASIRLNERSFDDFVFQLNPSVVVFDRYTAEEKFGWRVTEQCPNALKILDTEDLHFLRKAREEAVTKNKEPDLYSDIAKRELASILRSDLSLIISEYEMQLLKETFHIPESILYYLPFLVDDVSENDKKALPEFEERKDFMTIGNLLHTPNVDAVKYLKREIWPEIRKQLPKAELSIYGNYAPQYINEMHNPKEGFLIKGWTEDAMTVTEQARVCLAPLRFGAGLKGKLLDAMRSGTPAVTTSVGVEGMCGTLHFGGMVSDDAKQYASMAVELYSDKEVWKDAQEKGFAIVSQRFQKKHFSEAFLALVKMLLNNVKEHRQEHFLGQVLQHQTTHATKYMSKWIEAKNR